MKEFIEKLNEKLTYLLNNFGEHCEEWGSDKEGDCHRKSCSDCVLTHAIEIVNQLAEEYKTCYKSCTECEAYDKEKNHCPKFCYIIEETIKEIEENHSGWIPCSDRLPETSGEYYTYVYCDGHYIYSIDEIDCGGIVKEWNCSSDYKILAWKPITPYQPKGE